MSHFNRLVANFCPLFLFFGLFGCGKPDSVTILQEAWSVPEPSIVKSGAAEVVALTAVHAQDKLVLSTYDELVFPFQRPPDQNSKLTVFTTCDSKNRESSRGDRSLFLREKYKIFEFIPDELLLARKQEVVCAFQFRATNANGDSHSFALPKATVRLSTDGNWGVFDGQETRTIGPVVVPLDRIQQFRLTPMGAAKSEFRILCSDSTNQISSEAKALRPFVDLFNTINPRILEVEDKNQTCRVISLDSTRETAAWSPLLTFAPGSTLPTISRLAPPPSEDFEHFLSFHVRNPTSESMRIRIPTSDYPAVRYRMIVQPPGNHPVVAWDTSVPLIASVIGKARRTSLKDLEVEIPPFAGVKLSLSAARVKVSCPRGIPFGHWLSSDNESLHLSIIDQKAATHVADGGRELSSIPILKNHSVWHGERVPEPAHLRRSEVERIGFFDPTDYFPPLTTTTFDAKACRLR